MTDITPFNMSFPPESVVFVVDEYSQYKKAMIDDYCYTHSPIVITDIHQIIGKLAPPANKNLLMDCVLKWDDTREYNNVADVLRFHSTGLLMTMNKPAAFDPMIRAKVDYLVLFRGRNLRHLRRIHRQYLASFLDDPTIFTGLFKSLGWGQGLVLDLSAMQASGRFAGNYYKYSPQTDSNSLSGDNSFANLDVALGEWIANGITNGITSVADSDITLSQEPINSDWEIITAIDYALSRPAQPSSTPEPTTTQPPVEEPIPKPITPIPETTPEPIPKTDQITQESIAPMRQEPITSNPEPSTPEQKPENKPENTLEQQNQQTQGWASYLYSKAWSLFG
jgi:hypothetical protein